MKGVVRKKGELSKNKFLKASVHQQDYGTVGQFTGQVTANALRDTIVLGPVLALN